MAKIAGKSLALQKFYKSIELEIGNYWHINTSLIYSERWWKKIGEENFPLRISGYPGDNTNPFNSIDISPKLYLEKIPKVIQLSRENSIVGFITTFEVYLLDIVRRIIYLNPSIIDDSTMPFEAKEIASVLRNDNFIEWFSNKISDKYMRNKTHLKMIKRIQSLIKFDFETHNKALIEEWNKLTYLRNAIVHNGREVSEDLSSIWPDKFKKIGSPLYLTNAELVRVHYLAIELAKIIDRRIVETIIQDEDALLLVREIFIKEGIENNKILAKMIFDILNHRLRAPDIDKALGYQRRTNNEPDGWTFSHYNFIP